MTFLALLAVLAAAVWFYLSAGHGWFWRTDVCLPPARELSVWPAAALVVPARDEGEVLPVTLPALLAQQYPGAWQVVLVDDRSTDDTREVAQRAAQESRGRLTVLAGTEPPAGWTGKLWALQQGLAASQVFSPELVLFTDADIAHPPDSLRRLVAAAQGGGFDLVSQMALLPASRRWERLLIPAFVYFFAQLCPFRRVNRPGARTAAAAGGCLLLRADTLLRAGGLERVRGALIDDVAIARLIKRSGGKIWLGLASEVRSCRPYPRLADVWDMVARSAFTQLRYSYMLLGATVAGLLLLYLIPPVATVAGAVAVASGGGAAAHAALGAGLVAWALMTATYVPVLRHHHRHAFEAPLLPVTAALYLLMTLDSAWRQLRWGGADWKGRRFITGA